MATAAATCLRRGIDPFQGLGQIETGGKIVAMTENDASFGFFIRLGQGGAQLAVCLVVDRACRDGSNQSGQCRLRVHR